MRKGKKPEQPCKPGTAGDDSSCNLDALKSAQSLSAAQPSKAADSGDRSRPLTTRGQLGDSKGPAPSAGSSPLDALTTPIVVSAPTLAATGALPSWAPFSHFPASRGDFLAGEPIPTTRTAAAIAAMPLNALRRRLKALASMRRMARLGRPFVEAATAEALDLGNELIRRVRAQVLAAEADYRAKRKAAG